MFFALALFSVATTLLTSAQTLTTLHSFTMDDGAIPSFATPAQGRDGNIYATTSIGGSEAIGCFCGTAFKITPEGALTSFSFDGTDGAIPDAGLVLGPDGLLYGTTSSGDGSGNGKVFRLNPRTGHSPCSTPSPVLTVPAQRRLLRWDPAENTTGLPVLAGATTSGRCSA